MKSRKWLLLAVTTGAAAIGIAACGGDDDSSGEGGSDGGSGGGGVAGSIVIDGSSTVAPLSEAIAERFNAENPDAKVAVGTSGTGGGFEKFCAGETDISDASRAISSEEETLCADGGIDFSELRVATDALTVVANPANPVTCVTVEQLSEIWDSGSSVGSWSEVTGLDAEFGEDAELFGPGTDSGTFDYFTEAVNGEEGRSRTDYNNVGEDDNATVTAVSSTPGGIGYFGFSFFSENQEVLKALEIENPETGECVTPSVETAQNDQYVPLSRPLFIYASAQSLEKPEVQAFLEFYLDNVNDVAEQAGFIPLTEDQLSAAKENLASIAA